MEQNQEEVFQQLAYYMHREKELLEELRRRQIDATNLKDLALAYEDLEAERNSLQVQMEDASRRNTGQGVSGESTDRDTYERRILDVVHELNIKTKQFTQLETDFKQIQEENAGLNTTIQHFESFVSTLRNQHRSLKAQIDEKLSQNNNLKQELEYMVQNGAQTNVEPADQHLLMRLQQIIAQRESQISELRQGYTSNVQRQIDNRTSEWRLAYQSAIGELKEKEGHIHNLQKRMDYMSEETRLSQMNAENKTQEIFKLKRHLLQTEHKWIASTHPTLDIVKPRSVIDGELMREMEALKSLRPQLETTKEALRRKEMEVLELRQNKESEVSRVNNQNQELRYRLTACTNQLQEERLQYNQWKLAHHNNTVKQSIRPSNPVSIIQTYEKEVNQVYGRLQHFRGEYIQMKKASQERSGQLEIQKGELLFKINEVNKQLWVKGQQIELLLMENRTLKQQNANLRLAQQDSNTKINNLFSEVTRMRQGVHNAPSEAQGHERSNGPTTRLHPRHNVKQLSRQDQVLDEQVERRQVVNSSTIDQQPISSKGNIENSIQTDHYRQTIELLEQQNAELIRILEGRDTEINHLHAAVSQLTTLLMEHKAKVEQLQGVSEGVQNEIRELRDRNYQLSHQKESIKSEIEQTQNTINLLAIRMETLKYQNSQYEELWKHIDEILDDSRNMVFVLDSLNRWASEAESQEIFERLKGMCQRINAEIESLYMLREGIRNQVSS